MSFNPIQFLKSFALITLFSLAFIGTAQADSGASASASCTVDWSAATFSFPAVPTRGPHPPPPPNSLLTRRKLPVGALSPPLRISRQALQQPPQSTAPN